MYDLIDSIINHSPAGSYYTSEEQLIYAISGVIICIVFFTFVDLTYRVFRNFIK